MSTHWGPVQAGRRGQPLWPAARSAFAGAAPSNRRRIPGRSVLSLLALACAMSLIAANQSSAAGFVVRRDQSARSLRPHAPRRDEIPPPFSPAVHNQPDARPTADGASLPVLLVLALNSAVVLIRLVSAPPSWMRD
jgi:hypothetical protein